MMKKVSFIGLIIVTSVSFVFGGELKPIGPLKILYVANKGAMAYEQADTNSKSIGRLSFLGVVYDLGGESNNNDWCFVDTQIMENRMIYTNNQWKEATYQGWVERKHLIDMSDLQPILFKKDIYLMTDCDSEVTSYYHLYKNGNYAIVSYFYEAGKDLSVTNLGKVYRAKGIWILLQRDGDVRTAIYKDENGQYFSLDEIMAEVIDISRSKYRRFFVK